MNLFVDGGASKVKIACTLGTDRTFCVLLLLAILTPCHNVMLVLMQKKNPQQQLMTTKELRNTKILQLTALFYMVLTDFFSQCKSQNT